MTRPTRATAEGRAYLDLQNLARRQSRPTQELLVLYVLERFLARLADGPHRHRFVLKGGMLLAALGARRPTVDADLLATQLSNHTDDVLARVVEIADAPADPDDGVRHLTGTAKDATIREGDLYAGVRVTMNATVADANVKLQLDINFGDRSPRHPRRSPTFGCATTCRPPRFSATRYPPSSPRSSPPLSSSAPPAAASVTSPTSGPSPASTTSTPTSCAPPWTRRPPTARSISARCRRRSGTSRSAAPAPTPPTGAASDRPEPTCPKTSTP